MKFLIICALFQSIYLFNSIKCDSIIWNVPSNGEYSFNDILSKSNQEPVVIFMHPNFDIGQFSRQANVFGLKNDGGRLKNLKKWIDRSEGYTVKRETLSSQLLQYFDTTEYNPNIPPVDDDLSVLLVSVTDWDDLDSKAEEVRRIFKGKKYVAILTTVAQYRKKRANPSTQMPLMTNYTYVEANDCKFYAEGIYFLTKVVNSTKSPKTTGTCKATLKNQLQIDSDDSDCGNFTGTIKLSYTNLNLMYDSAGCAGDAGSTLDTLTITFEFDMNNATDTWFVSQVSMFASGSMILTPDNTLNEVLYDHANRTWDFDYISGSQYFSYACSAPPQIYQADSPSVSCFGSTSCSVQYGLGFKNIQIQPFAALHNTTGSIMTDYIDDCTPFFNIYIWMSLIMMLLLVSIILCGMAMMGSLRTMDRFDDARAKTITVNVTN